MTIVLTPLAAARGLDGFGLRLFLSIRVQGRRQVLRPQVDSAGVDSPHPSDHLFVWAKPSLGGKKHCDAFLCIAW